ncbi:Protein Y71G10AR.4, partial [Aphelenchoides avenae]
LAANIRHDVGVISYEPPYIHDLVEGQKASFNITLSFSDGQSLGVLSEPTWNLQIESLHKDVAQPYRHTVKLLPEDFEQLEDDGSKTKVNVMILGGRIGKTALKTRLSVTGVNDTTATFYQLLSQGNVSLKADGQDATADYYDIWVIRDPSKRLLSDVFVGTLVTLISIAMVLMRCELDLSVLWETIRRPVAPAIGFFSQAVLMPLLAYGIAQLLLVPSGEFSFALGSFATGCSSNFWTIVLDANAHLSVTMTFISTLTSLDKISSQKELSKVQAKRP